MATVPVSYQLGPISAGANSPLGGFFGFINGLSNNYATGLNVAVNDPAAATAILSDPFGTPKFTPTDIFAINAAEQKGLATNPFVQIGQVGGTLLGTGTGVIGRAVGVGGAAAGPGVASGAHGAVQGVTTVASAGVAGGASGILPGLSAGIQDALGIGSGSGTGGNGTFLLIAAGLILILLFLVL